MCDKYISMLILLRYFKTRLVNNFVFVPIANNIHNENKHNSVIYPKLAENICLNAK